MRGSHAVTAQRARAAEVLAALGIKPGWTEEATEYMRTKKEEERAALLASNQKTGRIAITCLVVSSLMIGIALFWNNLVLTLCAPPFVASAAALLIIKGRRTHLETWFDWQRAYLQPDDSTYTLPDGSKHTLPPEVARIAKQIHAVFPEPRLRVQRLAIDPILEAHIGCQWHTLCVWDEKPDGSFAGFVSPPEA